MQIELETCFMLRRPLVGMALSVVLGMAGASFGLFSFEVLLRAALFFLLLSGLFFRSKSSTVWIFLSVALVSACRFMLGTSVLSEVEINQMQPKLPIANVEVIGRVAGPPAYYAYRSGKLGAWTFPLRCEGMKTSTGWVRKRGRIQVRVSGVPPEASFRQGARIRFSGELRQRDFPHGDPIMLAVSASNDWEILSAPSRLSPVIWGQRLREKAAVRLSKGIEGHPSQLAVLKALLLGYRKAIPPEIHQQFVRTGTMHIFAISGLHVGIVGLFITIILKSVGIPRDRWGIWLLPLLFFYVMATGMKSSALRAFTMAAVFFLSPMLRRKPDVPTSIAFAAIVLLLIHPFEILSVGFIFSFTVVSFLVMAFAVVPERILVHGKGRIRIVWAYITSLIITSIAAFIASIPLTALFFGSFSPISLIGNLAVVPLTFCVVLSGWLSILIPAASEIFNHAALVFINGLLGIVDVLANLPGAHGEVHSIPLLGILFWYIGWIRLLVHARTPQQRLTALSFVALAIVWVVVF